jgi:hypothetical protein
MVPVMLMGYLVSGKRYTALECAAAAAVVELVGGGGGGVVVVVVGTPRSNAPQQQ